MISKILRRCFIALLSLFLILFNNTIGFDEWKFSHGTYTPMAMRSAFESLTAFTSTNVAFRIRFGIRDYRYLRLSLRIQIKRQRASVKIGIDLLIMVCYSNRYHVSPSVKISRSVLKSSKCNVMEGNYSNVFIMSSFWSKIFQSISNASSCRNWSASLYIYGDLRRVAKCITVP